MESTRPETRTDNQGDAPDGPETGRVREEGVGIQTGDNPNTGGQGVGFAAEETSRDTEHKSDRSDSGGSGHTA